ncbi:BACON domain-containing protein [Prolixibacter sp. NT017]|uniref:BACON domain-containing protein n=1 Tax=Prolixibacter sp. NT017 TaxID=2652390 RepID=UPI00188F3E03|nr:BACON domain-containing protein [Prolixibacter sp. NT017]
MKFKLTVLFLVVLFSCRFGYAQSLLTNPVIIPPSPSVASFQQLDFSQVNLYNGLPSVDIPVYEINQGDFKFPINLSYHYSGFKVEEVAGWLGLGWSINAGGMISHIVRGKPDDDPDYGYNWVRDYLGIPDPIGNPSAYSSFTSGISSDKNTLRMFADGLYDGLPDDYIISANNLTGSIIDLDNGNYVSNPYRHYLIYKSSNRWDITDEAGNKYIFGHITGDSDVNYGMERTSYEYSNSTSNIAESETYTSGWFLREIITNTGDVIQFNYTSETIAKLPGISETRFKLLDFAGSCPEMFYSVSETTFMPVTTWKLSSIDSRSCHISFYSNTARSDRITGSNSCSLDSIVIKDSQNKRVKKFSFDYDYLGNTGNNETCRLVLKRVTESGSDGQVLKPPYIFGYDESVTVPSYSSKSQDFWGFYNGKTNTTFTPSNIPNSSYNAYFQGYANRNPDANYSKLGLLTSVTLPTKGEISYTYEPNDYGYVKGEANPSVPVASGTITSTAAVPEGSTTLAVNKMITLADDQTVVVNFAISNNGYPLEEEGEVRISPVKSVFPPIFSVKQNNTSGVTELALSAGVYWLTAQVYTVGHSASISVNYKTYEKDANGNIIYNKNLTAGGNRLKRSVQYDGISHGNDKVLTYDYRMADESDRSSGMIYGPINYDFSTMQAEVSVLYPTGTLFNEQFCTFAGRTSSNRAPLFGSDGYIGYQNVMVQEGENGGNGSTQYYFTTYPDQVVSGLSQSISKAYKRGKLLKVVKKDNAGNVKYAMENHYTSDNANEHGVAGLFLVEYSENNVQDYLDVFKAPYWGIIRSEWFYLSESVETYYHDNGNVIDTTFYVYGNPVHAQLTEVKKRRSDGKLLQTHYYYPSDHPSGITTSSAVVNSLISENRQVKLKVEKKVESGIVDGQVENYGSNLLPSDLSMLVDGTYQPGMHFDDYDSYGNLLQVTDKNGITTSYLWGYNSMYPVARIVNIAQADIPSSVKTAVQSHIFTNSTVFSNIQTDLNYLKSQLSSLMNDSRYMVTIYTYKPLVGMTSQTDPGGTATYFAYDSFGRLRTIKDDDSAIKERYTYHYGETGADLTISSTSLTFNSSGGTQSGSVTSTVSWTATDDQTWISVNPASGVNNGTVSITCSANTSTSSRSGVVTLTGGGITKTVTITQEGASLQLSVSPTSLVFNASGETLSCTVTSNGGWIVSSSMSWIVSSIHRGSGNATIQITCPANTSTTREGAITITVPGISKTVNITQSGGINQ